MMTTAALSELELFQALLERYFAQIGADDPLRKVRNKAWDHFLELGLPTRTAEVFRYIRLRPFFARSFEPAAAASPSLQAIAPFVYPECSRSVIVSVNGRYCPALSNTQALSPKLSIAPLDVAIRTFGAFLNNQWAKTLKEEVDPFAAVNAALHTDGIFLYIPPKLQIEVPIQLLNIVDTGDQMAMFMPRTHVFAGGQSEVSLYATTAVLSGRGYCINQVSDLFLEEGARVKFMQVNTDAAADSWHFDAVRASLKRDSSFKSMSVTNGSMMVRNDYKATLTGENGEVLLNGVWMLDEKREAHTHILMEHQAPHCQSRQLFKGVLSDISRSSFEGKILVRRAAQKTEAYQLNHNLVLSDRASADSKPNLEIFADDGKATHGATVGQLDQEQLFYLKARGCDEAESMLVYGFCKEVLDMFPLPSLQKEFTKRVQNYLKKTPFKPKRAE